MKALLLSFILALGCSAGVETTPPTRDAGCPPKGTIDPESGLPVGKDCGIDAGPECTTAADCPPSTGPCIWVSCQVGVCTATTCDDGNPCTVDTCSAGGACHLENVPIGVGCGESKVCNGAGVCVFGL